MGSQRVRHDWMTSLLPTHNYWFKCNKIMCENKKNNNKSVTLFLSNRDKSCRTESDNCLVGRFYVSRSMQRAARTKG